MAVNSQDLNQEQRQTMRLSQQQLRFVKLLECNAVEFDEAVVRELEDNPALTVADGPSDLPTDDGRTFEETPDQLLAADYPSREEMPVGHFGLRSQNGMRPDPGFNAHSGAESLIDHLMRQLPERRLPKKIEQAAEFIIGSLDSNGYLRRRPENIADDMAFGPGIDVDIAEIDKALEAVRSLDPPGVGAYDLRDALLLQLKRFPQSEERDDALRIIGDFFQIFSMKHFHILPSRLDVTRERVDRALDLILTLNPKPGAPFDSSPDAANVIVPDYVVGISDSGQITISLNSFAPELRVEESFEEALRQMKANKGVRRRQGMEFISARAGDARDFIKVVRQRQQTMLSVMTAIVDIQQDYFRSEDVYDMRPMMIKDVAARTGLDISVISRATTNKYVATPAGIFPVRFFFSDSIGDEEGRDGKEAVTNRKIEAAITALIEAEDKKHPLSDENIRTRLAEKGLDVSRRTVAKYRDRLRIPVARLRKQS